MDSLSNENLHQLGITARSLVEDGKGILAADESPRSIEKRLETNGIKNTKENRRAFRELLITTPEISKMIGGVILHDETFDQRNDVGDLLVDLLVEKGIAPGIKLDLGLEDLNDKEKISIGLDDLEERCALPKYKNAKFAKWRSIFRITENTPTEDTIEKNCEVLAKYAFICQKHGLVPIVEPEILWDGRYGMREAYIQSNVILSCLMYHLNRAGVYIPGVVVKTGFVSTGKEMKTKDDIKEISAMTFSSLIASIPCGIGGVVFLSGGHSPEDSTEYLNNINKEKGKRTWKISFSFGRALTDPVLAVWKGDERNKIQAQEKFKELVKRNYLAARGEL
ncbi:Fructose-bisphosphate aldolase [Astathelohania contejeani]|uniref:fructose-bisphosphate aldolase n=1 Tax=Astathelohania contejeani TaxID=164912 RepID=A0ABQ7HXC7_9MICR|nr:Fructose-bisphosphate aldolase [Thelohania contejeani]